MEKAKELALKLKTTVFVFVNGQYGLKPLPTDVVVGRFDPQGRYHLIMTPIEVKAAEILKSGTFKSTEPIRAKAKARSSGYFYDQEGRLTKAI